MNQAVKNLKALKYQPYRARDRADLPDRVCSLVGGPVPADYLDFLREFPSTGVFGVEGTVGVGAFALDMLLASCDDKRYDLCEIASRPLHDGDMPRELLLIGDNDFGNAFGLGLRTENFGQVFYWDHEGGALRLVAPSFSEFLANLQVIT